MSLHPLPDADALAAFYQKTYWQAPVAQRSLPGRAYAWRMAGVMRQLAAHMPRGGRILDVGAGDGAFMALCAKAGFDVWGVDRFAPQGASPRLLRGELDGVGLAPNSFDAVSFLHVLEHLENPAAALASAVALLKPGGIILAEMPNSDSLVYSVFRQRWQPLEIPTHFNLFSPRSLTALVSRLPGARVLRVSQFSLRASPAALALSLVPGLQPRLVRQRHKGVYPTAMLLLYLALQLASAPLAAGAAALGRGCIFRALIAKDA